MFTLEISSLDAHPMEIFAALEKRRAEVAWAQDTHPVVFPFNRRAYLVQMGRNYMKYRSNYKII